MSRITLDRLGSFDLFARCRRADLAAIDRLGVTVDLPAGRTLCSEGTPGKEFFVLLAGFVDVCTAFGTAALLRPGAWFGEAALLDGAPRRATVTTRTPVTVIVFGKREFNALLAVKPRIRAQLEQTTAQVVAGAAPTREPWYQPVPSGLSNLSFDAI
jgi:CRP-like cAMP-binding protein